MEGGSPRMTLAPREMTVSSSPAVAANAEGEEIEVLETTDVYPVAPEDVSNKTPLDGSCNQNAVSNTSMPDLK